MINAYQFFVGKSERKKTFRRPRRRWKAIINMEIREIGIKGVDWTHLA
jgi:hypothetical protein